ncbi:MAG: DUF3106 domain-containing protein [Pseudomonadota bacterium]
MTGTRETPQPTRRWRAVVFAALLAATGAVVAQSLPATGPIDWSRLSAAQRGVLAPLERDWKTISPGQQQKWAEVANRFPALPIEERGRVQQRLADWSRLSSQERASARLNFQEARQLSPQERQQQWDAYRALPADQRRALADNAERTRPSPNPKSQSNSEGAAKSSLVRSPAAVPAQPVGPTVVRRGAGASTDLVSRPAKPPLHQQAGLPKVAATPGFVDSATLLPQRGAQGAAARAPERDNDKPRQAQ